MNQIKAASATKKLSGKQPAPVFTKIFRDDEDDFLAEGSQDASFENLFTESVSKDTLSEGQVILGRVVGITPESVLIDVGHKCEGEAPAAEFRLPNGELEVKVGDEIYVVIERMEGRTGMLSLSKDKADVIRAWDEIAEACEKKEILEGMVKGVVKGGLIVDIGVKAFLPGSQIDVRPVKDLDQFVGKSFKFKVIKFNKKRGNIVLSRRAVLEEERDSMKSSTLKQLKVGAVVRGTIKNITDYGAFVDLGGVDGLLHITDMSWGRIKHPSDVLTVGQEINVRILKYDSDKERVSLGLKQTQPDPWEGIPSRYGTGQRIKGRIISITDYGAFVEIEPGVEGLIHVSEMSWTQKVKDPRKLLNADQEIEAVILDIDLDNRRMSLGLKQIEPNPWDTIQYKYPVGSKVKGSIKNITDFGLFVGLEEGIDGLVHVSDLSWDAKVSHPSQMFEKGQDIEAIVSNIDRENERISLSIKLLSGDPWSEVAAKYPAGSLVDVVVNRLTNFGAFVELEKGVEGMIHVSELSEERVSHPEQVVKVGDTIKALITNLDMKDRKISLSVKAIGRQEEKSRMESFKNSQPSHKSSLADTLNPEIAAKLGLLGNKEKAD